jgi:hypothetical protein
VHKEMVVLQDQLDLQVLKVQEVLQAVLVLQVHKEMMVLLVLQVLKDFKVLKHT